MLTLCPKVSLETVQYWSPARRTSGSQVGSTVEFCFSFTHSWCRRTCRALPVALEMGKSILHASHIDLLLVTRDIGLGTCDL